MPYTNEVRTGNPFLNMALRKFNVPRFGNGVAPTNSPNLGQTFTLNTNVAGPQGIFSLPAPSAATNKFSLATSAMPLLRPQDRFRIDTNAAPFNVQKAEKFTIAQ